MKALVSASQLAKSGRSLTDLEIVEVEQGSPKTRLMDFAQHHFELRAVTFRAMDFISEWCGYEVIALLERQYSALTAQQRTNVIG